MYTRPGFNFGHAVRISSTVRSKQLKNPFAGLLIWLGVAFFTVTGVSFITPKDWHLAEYIFYILFLWGLAFTVWTIVEFRNGRISTISNSGQISTVIRSKEPVVFFIVVFVYLGLGIILTGAMGYFVLFGN